MLFVSNKIQLTKSTNILLSMKRLSKLFQLNSIEKILLCQGLFILVLVRLGLFLMSFAKLKHDNEKYEENLP